MRWRALLLRPAVAVATRSRFSARACTVLLPSRSSRETRNRSPTRRSSSPGVRKSDQDTGLAASARGCPSFFHGRARPCSAILNALARERQRAFVTRKLRPRSGPSCASPWSTTSSRARCSCLLAVIAGRICRPSELPTNLAYRSILKCAMLTVPRESMFALRNGLKSVGR